MSDFLAGVLTAVGLVLLVAAVWFAGQGMGWAAAGAFLVAATFLMAATVALPPDDRG